MSARAAGCLVPILLALTSGVAYAADTASEGDAEGAAIAWRCVQEFDASFHVLCIPAQVGTAHTAMTSEMAGARQYPLDRLPVAQRGDAEVFSTKAWRVPLHSKPNDASMVVELLKSVLCGKHPECKVEYGRSSERWVRR
jgi:hypothetical protein